MMSYTDAENGKVALMQEILGVKDIQDIDLLYELHQEFMDAQKNAGTGNRGQRIFLVGKLSFKRIA